MDDIAPVIEINGQIKTTAKVGDVLTLPTYNVTDNKTQDSKLLKYVYLSTPTFGYKTISVGDDMGTYIFQVEGDYTLVYFAMDDSSNYSYKTFTIHVTK